MNISTYEKKLNQLVIVIDSLAGGGAEQTMLRLASTLTELGRNVRLIVINQIVSHEVPANIKIDFVHKAGRKRGIKYFYYRKTAIELQAILDELHKQQPIEALLSVLPETDRITQYIKKYRVFHCIRNNFYYGMIKNKKACLTRWIKIKKLQKIYNGKHLLFISEGAKQAIVKDIAIKPLSSAVIYNPYPIRDIQELSKSHAIEYQDYFIHVGRFNPQKRHDRLLKLYAESEISNPLLLMGEGNIEETQKINKLIQQYSLEHKVFIIGFKKNPFPYIRQAIALLLTSDHEGLCNVIIESLICGTPVLAFDCPSGPSEILVGTQQEFLIPLSEPELFKDKLKNLSQERLRISEEDANIKRFEAKAIASQYISAITDLSV